MKNDISANITAFLIEGGEKKILHTSYGYSCEEKCLQWYKDNKKGQFPGHYYIEVIRSLN